MVGLPSVEARAAMFAKYLPRDRTLDLDYLSLARLTEGYSGSDVALVRSCYIAVYPCVGFLWCSSVHERMFIFVDRLQKRH